MYKLKLLSCFNKINVVCCVGWISSIPHYCQTIRNVNKEKRRLWCHQQTVNNEDFKEVVFTDECTVMIERKRKSYRRVNHSRKLKPKPKHPQRIHIWGGILGYTTDIIQGKSNSQAIC